MSLVSPEMNGDEEPSFENLRVMVIDDSAEMRAVLCEMLENMGINAITESPNGTDAMITLFGPDTPIDIVVCDWNMPRMSGLDLLKHVRGAGYDTPFIMLTGRGGGLESINDARNNGATAFIQKPCSAARLEIELRMVWEKMRNSL